MKGWDIVQTIFLFICVALLAMLLARNNVQLRRVEFIQNYMLERMDAEEDRMKAIERKQSVMQSDLARTGIYDRG